MIGMCVCVRVHPSGPAVCVDGAEAVYGRRGLAGEENVAVRGDGVLGEAGRRTGSVHRSAARLPHLLLLEEEQKV